MRAAYYRSAIDPPMLIKNYTKMQPLVADVRSGRSSRSPRPFSKSKALYLTSANSLVAHLGRGAADRPDRQLPRGIEAAFFPIRDSGRRQAHHRDLNSADAVWC